MTPALKSEVRSPTPDVGPAPAGPTAAESPGARAASPATRAAPPRVLLLGLGNDILCDDAIGLRIAAEVRHQLAGARNIEVVETAEMGLSLLDFIADFHDLVLVDAVQTGHAPPGFLHEFEASDLKTLPAISPHFLGIGEVLALGRELGLPVPRRVRIFAVEVADPFTVSAKMTPALQHALPGIVTRVTAALLNLAN